MIFRFLTGASVLLLSLPAMAHMPAPHECKSQNEGLDLALWRPVADLRQDMAENGIEFGLSSTLIYQQNARGGLSTHNRAGRFSGSFDYELNFDLERLAGIEDSVVYMLAESSFSKSGSITDPAVGSYFSVNGDGSGRRAFDITELWLETTLADGAVALRVGKLDLTGGFECRGCPVSFDGNMFANDETSQFLNDALVNNPAIPFPDNGLGAILFFNNSDFWYISAGIADAQADARETGFSTAFTGEDYYFAICEAGITPQLDSAKGHLQGAYRFGLWYDPQPKERFKDGRSKRDDVGFYASCDQILFRENSDPDDSQGLGAFARFGYADDDCSELDRFYSFGVQYQGLFDGRDEDVLGLGFACGRFSDYAGFDADSERVIEMYYSFRLSDNVSISPDIQFVKNPGGSDATRDAIVAGLRVQIGF